MTANMDPGPMQRMRIGEPSYKNSGGKNLITSESYRYLYSQCCGSASLDPDPAFHFDADPDPDQTFHFDADLDPDPSFHFVTTLMISALLNMYIRSLDEYSHLLTEQTDLDHQQTDSGIKDIFYDETQNQE